MFKEEYFDKNIVLAAVGGRKTEWCDRYGITDYETRKYENGQYTVVENTFSRFDFEPFSYCRVVAANGTTTTVVTEGKIAMLRFKPYMRMTSGCRPEEYSFSIIRPTDGFNWVNHEVGEQYVVFALDERAQIYQIQRGKYDPAKEVVIEVPNEVDVRSGSTQLRELQKDFWLQYYALKHICENDRIK